MKSIKLYQDDTTYDLTDYVNFPIIYDDDISRILDTASFGMTFTPNEINTANYIEEEQFVHADFPSDVSFWTANASINSSGANSLINTGDGTATNPRLTANGIQTIANAKYFLKARVRVSSIQCTEINIGTGNAQIFIKQLTPVANQWYELAIKGSSASVTELMRITHQYPSNTVANGSTLEVDWAIAMPLDGKKYENETTEELDARFTDYVPYAVNPDVEKSLLDLSNPIKPLSRIEYTDGEVVKNYVIREDKTETLYLSPLEYNHTNSLIEATTKIEKHPVADFTITQPKTTVTYALSNLKATDTSVPEGVETTLTMVNTTLPTNVLLIDGVTLVQAGLVYTINAVFTLRAVLSTNYIVRVYINGIEIEQRTLNVSEGVGIETIVLNYTSLIANEDVELTIAPLDDIGLIDNVSLSITSKEEIGNTSLIYLDDVIDKALLSFEVADINNSSFTPTYTLGEQTRAAISNVLSPELTFTTNTVWEVISTVANVVEAIPRLGETTWNEITFDFINDRNRINWVNPYETSDVKTLDLENYCDSIEINADNVIESIEGQQVLVEPYQGGWMTLRSTTDGPNQLTDTTVGLKLRNNHYELKQVIATGFTIEFSDTTTQPATIEYDISDYVVEQKRWIGLPNNAFVTSRSSINLGKGNTLYYTSGSNRLLNFGYRAPQVVSGLLQAQAIYQVIASVAEQRFGKTVSLINGAVASQTFADLLDTKYRVYGITISKMRTKVFKHNARDFPVNATLYSNEQAKVNDASKLGRTSQSLVNRSGNRTRLISGETDELSNVPQVGNLVNSKEIVTNVNVIVENNTYLFTATLFDDYTEVSNFVGINSEFRQYEVSNENVVFSQLNYIEPITFARELGTPTHSILTQAGLSEITLPFGGVTASGLTYHTMQTRNDYKIPTDGDWLTFNSESEGPVDVKAIGATTVISVNPKDNYSVGNSFEELYEATVLKQYQNDYSYVDALGRVDSIRYNLYSEGAQNNTVADGNLYPEISTATSANKLLGIDIRALKGARDRTGLTITMPFFARKGNDDFRVYNGIAKYNGLAIQDTDADLVAILWEGEFPSVNTKTMPATDYLETFNFTVNGISFSNYIKLEYTLDIIPPETRSYDGWGVINKNNNDILFLTKIDIPVVLNGGIPTVFEDDIYIYTDDTKGL